MFRERLIHNLPYFEFVELTLYYNAEGDYYVCSMGQHMERIGTMQSKTESGYVTENTCYKAQRYEGCPFRGSCFKTKGDRIIESQSPPERISEKCH